MRDWESKLQSIQGPQAGSYTEWPRKNGTVGTVDFQDFAIINSYFLHFVG